MEEDKEEYKIPQEIEDLAEDIGGGWFNYRLVEKESKWTDIDGKEHIEYHYDIHEIYYNGAGEIWAWTENPMTLYFENIHDYKIELNHIKQACKHKILKLVKEIDKDGKEHDKLVRTNKLLKHIK